jgi:hypothetical protein
MWVDSEWEQIEDFFPVIGPDVTERVISSVGFEVTQS